MSGRDIVIGKNSTVWRALAQAEPLRLAQFVAIGHGELNTFAFRPDDRVWVLSYARDMDANKRMFEQLRQAGDVSVIYISTATANVDEVTRCYEYPRVKRECERLSRSMLNALILRIGVVYRSESELPGGPTMATRLSEIAAFMADAGVTRRTQEPVALFSAVTRPFSSALEHAAFGSYGILQRWAPWPCLLRPLDIVLRALGWRWYGYLYLSNRLWLTTIS